ncbi:MAG: trypsin-like peptidase domain-containing protein [Vicinamibacterales bacterium]
MSTRKTTLFYALLIAVSSLIVGMIIASRLDLSPASSAQTLALPPMNSSPVTGPIDAQTFRNVAKAQSPMVVNIRTETRQRAQDLSDFFGGGGGGQSPDDLLRRFFGGGGNDNDPDDAPQGQAPNRRRREQTTVAAGTGFIISKDGLILTNNHVVDGATKIEVSLYGEDIDQLYEAKLIGRDVLTDTALIQLTQKPDHVLPEAKFGDSSQMAAGDWVMAIGNPFGFRHTVTVGVISATERAFPVTDGRSSEMLQTDAAINPGNSGGPLLNLRGEVVGMNTAIISNGRAEGNIGIGFAVPINTIRTLLPQLHSGKVVRGRIGVQITAVPREGYEDLGLKSRKGAIVSSVASGGAAQKAGIKAGDVIVEFNGKSVATTNELQNLVTATKPGAAVPVKVIRDGKERSITVTIDELDLEAEQGRQSRNQSDEPAEQGGDSFGLTLGNVTSQMGRRLQLPSGVTGAVITDVDPNGPSAGFLRPGDVITAVNGTQVSSASEAGRELQKVESGRIARILVFREGNEVFVTVKKE